MNNTTEAKVVAANIQELASRLRRAARRSDTICPDDKATSLWHFQKAVQEISREMDYLVAQAEQVAQCHARNHHPTRPATPAALRLVEGAVHG